MSRKSQTNPTDQEKKATAAAEAASGPETPATGNEGAAEAGEATAVAAPAEAAAPAPMIGAEGWEVVVTGPARGRWRAGRHFGPEPVVIPAVELTEAEARAIADDPQLTFVPRRID
jgi:hypothetical protein